MADVESSSSVMQQPPTSTSSHMNSIPLLQAAELLADNNSQMIQQQQQIQSASGTGVNGSGAASSVVSGSGMLRSINTSVNPSPASTSAGSNLVVIDSPQLGTQVGNNNGAVGDCSSLARLGTGEPPAKKQMLDHPSTSNTAVNHEKLEYRLGGILCCAVCLDLPKTAMYQCQMGHLMCAACFTHLLADGRLRDQIATCPNCRVEISKSTASRNLAVEKAASELPSECQFCNKEFPYKSLDRHELHECQERPTNCKYSRIGCQWRGPNHEATQHECNCLHPNKSGYEVMAALELYDASLMEEKKIFNTLIELLSYEKIIFNDLQMKPYRTDEYVHKLFYETARFSAFNQQWVVKARINNSQRDPHQSNERNITYQLILKTKTAAPMSIHFFALKGPFSDMKVSTQIYRHDFSDQTTESDYYNFPLQEPFSDMNVVQIHLHEFTDQSTESDYYILPLPDSSECNRLLSNKGINFRLLMFLLNK